MSEEDWHFDPERQTYEGYAWDSELLSERKRYLFMAAVGYYIAPLMTQPACVRVVEACEAYAEGLIDAASFDAANDAGVEAFGSDDDDNSAGEAANRFIHVITDDGKHFESMGNAVYALAYREMVRSGLLGPTSTDEQMRTAWDNPVFLAALETAKVPFTRFMHDIFGNPFRPVVFDPEWRTSTAVALGRQMYEARDFALMPILADAL